MRAERDKFKQMLDHLGELADADHKMLRAERDVALARIATLEAALRDLRDASLSSGARVLRGTRLARSIGNVDEVLSTTATALD